jgi:transposase-like protein
MARVYSDEDRALVYVMLDSNQGNVKRTARETGVPIATVRLWKQKREKEGGLPANVQAALPTATEEFKAGVERVRDKARRALEMRLDGLIRDPSQLSRINPKDLATTTGILTDKVRLLEGKPTSHTDHTGSGGNLPIEQVRELFAGFARGLVEGAQQRDASISSAVEEEPIEAEYVEQADFLALPRPAS